MPQLADLEYRSLNDCDYDGFIGKTLKCIAAEILDNGYLTGDAFSGADIQMSYVLQLARMGKRLDAYPSLEKYMTRLEQRPAYKRSGERGDPLGSPLGRLQ